ncbi:hypothetical protein [Afipia sp. GAS231]|uniref:hypothetical protein n=1 Tax=Afipia sp. GAS231 TaxID=1882747 RepID=UPI00087C9B1B|nr:hypothetical protein [Afipia sp. GAS231]SDM84836.1 hypothetical protein SAMN05444050_0003 [Afipia sp. GAS231]
MPHQSPDLTLEVNGTPPEIVGRACQGFICESYTFEGERVASANVTYLKFGSGWFRLYFEFRLVFWRPFTDEPKPREVKEETWAYAHTDVGALAGVLGQPLVSYEMLPTLKGSKVVFRFGNGRCVEIEDKDDATSYAVI